MTAGDCLDRELYVAFQILDYALCSAPGAPLKQVLLDNSMGKDIYSEFDNGIRQPFFSVVASDTDTAKADRFVELIDGELQRIAREGFDRKALLAGINHYEFRYREADFGNYPKGLMYGLQMLDSWLYADDLPFIHVEANDTYARLREKAGQGYFEKLVQTYLIDNSHKSMVILEPKKGMAQAMEEELKAQLAKVKAGMSREQLEDIIAQQQALTAYQEQEDSKEDLAKIPMLAREDIGRDARKLINEETRIGEIPALRHNLFTNGIAYIRLVFSLDQVPERLYPYVGIFKDCLGLLNTANYSYGALSTEIDLNTGGISAATNVYGDVDNTDICKVTLDLKTKVLYNNIDRAMELIREIAMTSDFTDGKRLMEIVAEGQSQLQAYMTSRGHSVAMNRALAYGSVSGAISETLSGIPHFRLLSRIQGHFEEEKEALVKALQELAAVIFRRENLLVDYVGAQEGWEKTAAAAERLAQSLYTCSVETGDYRPMPERKQEGFTTAGQVLYVCRAGNFKKKGLPYRGTLRFLKVMMEYEYL
ncbi:MAG: insulinase family protein, partial [Acetatifactor sp.]|nr:insulinase family protein [Acetatifactor sp.]